MSETPNTNPQPTKATVTFDWHGQSVTMVPPAKRPKMPKKPSWFLSMTKPLTYANAYDQYLVQLDQTKMAEKAFELAQNPNDRPNVKKLIGTVLAGAAILGGGAAIVSAVTNNDTTEEPKLIESPDSTVE